MKSPLVFLAAAISTSLAACGILSAPVSLPAAVAENASFSVKGPVVDQNGKSLDGVVVQLRAIHHFWTPLKGSTDVYDNLTRRVESTYQFDARGSSMELTFTKDGFYPATYTYNADDIHHVTTRRGTWTLTDEFPVVLLPVRPDDMNPAYFDKAIAYDNYPLADSISLPNLATAGRSGDVLYSGKDAEDPTIFPPGTLYLTLDKEAPPAIDAKGNIDPADLDIPHHITLHLPGNLAGFIRIAPRADFDPITTSDAAPADGYLHELTFNRARLKAMRAAPDANLVESREFFFFHAGNYFGKGDISWASRAGEPQFRFELYLQPEVNNRNLITHRLAG